MSDFMDQFNDKQTQATFDSADVQKNKVVCILAYIPILFLYLTSLTKILTSASSTLTKVSFLRFFAAFYS